MSTETALETTISTEEKLRLYLHAHAGFISPSYEVAPLGKCWKARDGRFTIKSRFVYTKAEDGKVYNKGFFRKPATQDQAYTELEALKVVFFGHLKASRVHLCGRCGGAGGAVQWPGFTCYDCGGNGIDPHFNWERALERALDGEDFAGDYLANVEAKKLEAKAEQERQQAERAIARQKRKADEFARVQECVKELAPRAFKARTFYRIGSEELTNLLILERLATATVESFDPDCYNTTWIQNFALPAILKAEEACKRAAEDASDFIGAEGEPITVDAVIVFQKDFDSAYGTKTLNVLRDDKGNRVTYWNHFTIVDPIEAQAFASDGKRVAKKGDKIRFTATVKKHEVYKGVRGTVVQRARKAVLIKSAAEETK